MYEATAAHTARIASRPACRTGVAPRHRRRPESVFAPVLVFVVAAGLLIAVAALPTVSDSAPATATRRVRVAASDTLWSIARANPVAGLSTARTVAAMRALNHLGERAALQPGAVISVPSADGDASNLAMR